MPGIIHNQIKRTQFMTEHYELVYLVKVSTSEKDVKNLENQVATYIKGHGEVLKSGEIGNRKLAYEIEHETHAIYWLFDFNCETDAIKELHRTLTLDEHVLRFLIVSTKQKTTEQIEKEQQMHESAEKALIKTQHEEKEKVIKEEKEKVAKMKIKEPKEQKEKEKLSLDELDKKLDELLEDDSLNA